MTARPKKLLNIDANAKTVKGQKRGYLTAVLYLAPADLSGYEVCPQRSAGCTAACLNTAGRAGIFKAGETTNPIQQARIAKTKWYFEDRAGFMAQLVREIERFVLKANNAGLIPVVRLNGTSDIPWERIPVSSTCPNIMVAFPDVQFYDYTKVTKRALAHARGDMPTNYHLTFSLTEDNDADAVEVYLSGGNVAAVFKVVSSTWLWFVAETGKSYRVPVVDGDETDLRHLDARGVIVGLKAKGKARHDTSGFVR